MALSGGRRTDETNGLDGYGPLASSESDQQQQQHRERVHIKHGWLLLSARPQLRVGGRVWSIFVVVVYRCLKLGARSPAGKTCFLFDERSLRAAWNDNISLAFPQEWLRDATKPMQGKKSKLNIWSLLYIIIIPLPVFCIVSLFIMASWNQILMSLVMSQRAL